jgi:predicted ABC-type ATPase
MPTLIMLAGSNGAGKSTFYESFLKDKSLPFINADNLAKELNLDPYEAARMASDIREQMVSQGMSFISETVFSDPVGDKVSFLENASRAGYEVTLIFIGIESVDLSRERVASRVRAGGHNVPSEKLEQRYSRTLQNLSQAIATLPRVILFDNSQFDMPFRFVSEYRNGKCHKKGKEPTPHWASSAEP